MELSGHIGMAHETPKLDQTLNSSTFDACQDSLLLGFAEASQ